MMGIPLLFEDETLLAADKPAGLRAIPDGYDPTLPHLAGLLREKYGPLWVVHRLDKDTSGVMLFARTADAHRHLNQQFEQRATRKEYHALVVGQPDWQEREIKLPLRVNGDRKHRTIIDHKQGKSAATTCRVLKIFSGTSLVAALPHSGYTHQIRAHLAAVGLPVLSDPLYKSLLAADRGKPSSLPDLPIQRTALHASRLIIAHPLTGEMLTITAPYPLDFVETIDVLSNTPNTLLM